MQSFEEKLVRLEQINEKIRGGDANLEESIKLFDEGVKLAKSLEKELAKVERKVEMLVNQPGPEESPQLELFPEDDRE